MEIKQDVRNFYNEIGWQEVGDGIYQNTRYEDLRPISQEYIHRCHMRVSRHLKAEGRFFLDAGSGPIQYDEYLAYSKGYQYRVCVDVSTIALKEAQKKIGQHGFLVVADIANLPFRENTFDGVVSLHAIHHLPRSEHKKAFTEIHRILCNNRTAVVVNGWNYSPLMEFFRNLLRIRKKGWLFARRLLKRKPSITNRTSPKNNYEGDEIGTFVEKNDPDWLKRVVGKEMDIEIRVWRSVNVRFLRNFVSEKFGGRQLLRLVFWLEEQFPHFFGEKGSYPLIVLRKS